MKRFLVVPLLATLAMTSPLLAQESHRVQFESGNDNASADGSVTGSGYVDYLLGAKAGQTMAVSISSENGMPYFNILPPGSSGEAIYNSSSNGNDATGIKLTADGEYIIRVYLMGNEADQSKAIQYILSMAIM
jgi:hypothetical protein